MEILNTYSVYNESIIMFIIISLAILLICAIVFVASIFDKAWKCSLVTFIIICILCYITYFGLFKWYVSTETKYYETVITDYNKLDFNKYEIVDKKGKITVIKDIR